MQKQSNTLRGAAAVALAVWVFSWSCLIPGAWGAGGAVFMSILWGVGGGRLPPFPSSPRVLRGRCEAGSGARVCSRDLTLCLGSPRCSCETPVLLQRLPDTLIGTPAMIRKKFQIKPVMLYSSGRKHLFINTAGTWGLHYYYFLLTLKRPALAAAVTRRRQVPQSLSCGRS